MPNPYDLFDLPIRPWPRILHALQKSEGTSATATEIDKWLAKQAKSKRKSDQQSVEVALARYLKSVSKEEWARLGVTQLKKIRATLEKTREK